MGLGAIVAFPILYGVMGFISAWIGAWLYNLIASRGAESRSTLPSLNEQQRTGIQIPIVRTESISKKIGCNSALLASNEFHLRT
jgi:hypothetical protein